ncbi:DUF6090 family protein [Lentiprolixibacter aurantiacus]|uniref:DUF6090 family protein n=1 Tax=Lentiprolixibacter aurantiacus TaxID=2993939 RepID=A0AAE3MKN2_9FLAO|nr:DUF6090 family protein [Lentiprolixibacter aurantiacus]MCX2719179.1 DUF6090 family protein [Lentiprolixibacter aurantiacus]
MIKFFRRIRQQLLTENNFRKYMIYAIGEIILVVIGILIALQINNWNEGRKEFRKSKALLEEFRRDLARDTIESNLVMGKLARRIKIESWALNLTSYNPRQLDSLELVFFSPYYQLSMTARTFNKLQNSENPNLSGFENLQNNLTKYYTDTKYLLDAYNEEEKHYAFYSEINQVIREKSEIYLSGFPMLPFGKEQSDNLIAFAQSIEGRNYIKENHIHRKGMIKYAKRVKKEAQELIQQINTGLEVEK